MHCPNLLVAVTRQKRTKAVHNESQDREYAEGPFQAQVCDHGVGGERVRQAAKPRAGGADAVGKGAAFHEPLRYKAN